MAIFVVNLPSHPNPGCIVCSGSCVIDGYCQHPMMQTFLQHFTCVNRLYSNMQYSALPKKGSCCWIVCYNY